MGHFFLHNRGVHSGACFLPPGCDCALRVVSRFSTSTVWWVERLHSSELCPQIGAPGEMARFGDLSNSRAMTNLEETVFNTYWCPHLNLNWKMWFLYVSFRNIGWFWKGASFRCFKSTCVFTVQFFIRGHMSPFFWSWGNAGKRSPFFGALFGRWIFVACQTSGSNASAVLHDPLAAIKPECIALACHSSEVGACGCCPLGGLVPFFFSWRCFFLWRFGCGDVGRFIFLWEKKGYIPRRFIFHEKNVNIFRNWKDSNFLLQAPWGFFWGECWEDFSPRKWWNWTCTNLSFHGVNLWVFSQGKCWRAKKTAPSAWSRLNGEPLVSEGGGSRGVLVERYSLDEGGFGRLDQFFFRIFGRLDQFDQMDSKLIWIRYMILIYYAPRKLTWTLKNYGLEVESLFNYT